MNDRIILVVDDETDILEMVKSIFTRAGFTQMLTAKELQLFEKLYENQGRIVTTGALCQAICGEFWQGYESTLATHIRHLREKIEKILQNQLRL